MSCKSSSHYRKGTLSRNWPGALTVRPRFCILKVLGDVLDNGELHFVERAPTLEAARRRIETLAEVRPGQYVIYNGETGERLLISAPSKPAYFSGQETGAQFSMASFVVLDRQGND
jgi:hypothetical protein